MFDELSLGLSCLSVEDPDEVLTDISESFLAQATEIAARYSDSTDAFNSLRRELEEQKLKTNNLVVRNADLEATVEELRFVLKRRRENMDTIRETLLKELYVLRQKMGDEGARTAAVWLEHVTHVINGVMRLDETGPASELADVDVEISVIHQQLIRKVERAVWKRFKSSKDGGIWHSVIEKLQKEVDTAEKRAKKLEEEIITKLEKLRTELEINFHRQSESRQREIAKLLRQVEELRALVDESPEHERELKELKNQLRKGSEMNAKLNENLKAKTDQVEAMSREMQEIKKELDDLRQHKEKGSSLNEHFSKMKSENAEYMLMVQDLTKAKSELSAELAECRENLAHALSECEKLGVQIEKRETRSASASASVSVEVAVVKQEQEQGMGDVLVNSDRAEPTDVPHCERNKADASTQTTPISTERQVSFLEANNNATIDQSPSPRLLSLPDKPRTLSPQPLSLPGPAISNNNDISRKSSSLLKLRDQSFPSLFQLQPSAIVDSIFFPSREGTFDFPKEFARALVSFLQKEGRESVLSFGSAFVPSAADLSNMWSDSEQTELKLEIARSLREFDRSKRDREGDSSDYESSDDEPSTTSSPAAVHFCMLQYARFRSSLEKACASLQEILRSSFEAGALTQQPAPAPAPTLTKTDANETSQSYLFSKSSGFPGFSYGGDIQNSNSSVAATSNNSNNVATNPNNSGLDMTSIEIIGHRIKEGVLAKLKRKLLSGPLYVPGPPSLQNSFSPAKESPRPQTMPAPAEMNQEIPLPLPAASPSRRVDRAIPPPSQNVSPWPSSHKSEETSPTQPLAIIIPSTAPAGPVLNSAMDSARTPRSPRKVNLAPAFAIDVEQANGEAAMSSMFGILGGGFALQAGKVMTPHANLDLANFVPPPPTEEGFDFDGSDFLKRYVQIRSAVGDHRMSFSSPSPPTTARRPDTILSPRPPLGKKSKNTSSIPSKQSVKVLTRSELPQISTQIAVKPRAGGPDSPMHSVSLPSIHRDKQ